MQRGTNATSKETMNTNNIQASYGSKLASPKNSLPAPKNSLPSQKSDLLELKAAQKTCKETFLKCEEIENKEFLDFLCKYVNKGRDGIKPSTFWTQARLGEKSYREVVIKRKRKLAENYKQRICIGIGIEWNNIVRIHIDHKFPNLDCEQRAKKVNELKNSFILQMGSPMKRVFILMKEGKDLKHLARCMHLMADNSSHLKRNS